HRGAKGLTVTDARDYLDFVELNLHSAAAAVSLLATPELVIYVRGVDAETRGQTLDDCDEPLPMRFTGRGKFQIGHIDPVNSRWRLRRYLILSRSSAARSNS